MKRIIIKLFESGIVSVYEIYIYIYN